MDDADDRAYVRAPTLDDLARVCAALNARGARYVLIGGFAVIAHGAVRTTKDIDLLVDPDPYLNRCAETRKSAARRG